MQITGCPREQTPDIRAALDAYIRSERGVWPIAGGWLDQTQKCLDAVEMIRDEISGWN